MVKVKYFKVNIYPSVDARACVAASGLKATADFVVDRRHLAACHHHLVGCRAATHAGAKDDGAVVRYDLNARGHESC